MSSKSEQGSSVLAVVVDFNSLLHNLASGICSSESVNLVLEQLIVFFTSYCLMHHQNRIVVVGFTGSKVDVLFPPANHDRIWEDPLPLPEISRLIRAAFQSTMEKEMAASSPFSHRSIIASALSTSLCVLNRLCGQRQSETQSRILVIQFHRDSNPNYSAVMNCVFSAQRQNTIIDALVLSSFDSSLLQQVSFLSGGIYLKNGDWQSVLPTLLTNFLADAKHRRGLVMPTQEMVEFKASCHCHKQPVDSAFMCSVCLTLLCLPPEDKCPVCEMPVRK